MNSQQELLETLRPELDDFIQRCGEDNFALLVEDLAIERLKTAISRLFSTQWWTQTIKGAMSNPTQYNTQLLCKLLDKAVPTQQAVKVGADDGFRLIIETVPVKEG